jgi:cation diffusion facilitator family transporter
VRTRHEFDLPPERERDLWRATRLEWLTIAYLSTVVLLMSLVMGQSQAMRTAWVEDLLSLVPPIGFLVAARFRTRAADEHHPFGYHRVINIAYLVSSLALFSMGVLLLFDAARTLIAAEHPTIGAVDVFGRTVWLGWLMLPVLLWATVPAFLLGRAKLSLAERLHDKPLYADAEMNKADWMTGAAAAAGVVGIALGWWWADAVAAAVISLDVLWDGAANLRAVVGDLMDRAPRSVDHQRFLDLPRTLAERVREFEWVEEVGVRLREEGHVMCGDVVVVPRDEADLLDRREAILRALRDLDWRLHDVSVQFVARENWTGEGTGDSASNVEDGKESGS